MRMPRGDFYRRLEQFIRTFSELPSLSLHYADVAVAVVAAAAGCRASQQTDITPSHTNSDSPQANPSVEQRGRRQQQQRMYHVLCHRHIFSPYIYTSSSHLFIFTLKHTHREREDSEEKV